MPENHCRRITVGLNARNTKRVRALAEEEGKAIGEVANRLLAEALERLPHPPVEETISELID